MKPIPYGRQQITEEDISAVVEALQSDFLTQGPRIQEFERAFAEYIGCKYAVAVANGTAALHLSALSLDVKPGDKVITTPITFAASANCIQYCGGEVVFADIDPKSYLLDVEKVRELLESHEPGTFKGIIPVDFAGRAVQMDAFRELADEFNLWLLEDSCHAPGGHFLDRTGQKQRCGNGKYADLAIFSFHPVKHIAAGEGGMITTDDQELYHRLLELRTHGITRNTEHYKNSREIAFGTSNIPDSGWPGWYMEMQELGYNYRLTDIQAALGQSQLLRADHGLKRRREIAKRYQSRFSDQSFICSQSGVIEGHGYHLYIICVEDRLGLYDYLKSQGVFAQIHYIPTHLMPYYREQGYQPGDYPNAENYYAHCLSLPMFPTLLDEELDHVIDLIIHYFD